MNTTQLSSISGIGFQPVIEKNRHVGDLTVRSLVAAIVIGLALGCTNSSNKTSHPSKRLRVVATTGMVADLVLQIGGDQVDVEQLMGSTIDPHLYQPNTDDVRSIRSADIVFYNGFKLEGRMADVLRNASLATKRHVAVAESIPKGSVMGDPEHDAVDPHVWMDVSLWESATHCVEKELSALRPDHANAFSERANDLRQRLVTLDATAIKWFESVPPNQRILITSHDAFRYFGRRYGMQVEGIFGISTASEAGLYRIKNLVELIVKKKVLTVFVESSVNKKFVSAVIEGAKDVGANVSIGGVLYSDAMGPAGSGAATYEGMMTHNFKTIVHALGGHTDASP